MEGHTAHCALPYNKIRDRFRMIFSRPPAHQYRAARSRWLPLAGAILLTATSSASGALLMYLKMDDPGKPNKVWAKRTPCRPVSSLDSPGPVSSLDSHGSSIAHAHVHVPTAGSTTLADSSGNGYNNNVIVNGGTTNGQYLLLDGASKQWVTLDASAIPTLVASASYTITACLRPQTTPAWSRFFEFTSALGSGSNCAGKTIWNGEVNYAGIGLAGFELYNDCGVLGGTAGGTATALSNSMWTQVAMASDGNYVST